MADREDCEQFAYSDTKWTTCDHKQLCIEDLGKREKLTLSGKTMMALLTKHGLFPQKVVDERPYQILQSFK